MNQTKVSVDHYTFVDRGEEEQSTPRPDEESESEGGPDEEENTTEIPTETEKKEEKSEENELRNTPPSGEKFKLINKEDTKHEYTEA